MDSPLLSRLYLISVEFLLLQGIFVYLLAQVLLNLKLVLEVEYFLAHTYVYIYNQVQYELLSVEHELGQYVS